ncbi:MAG: carboxypeptidase-like regulatory domain-containing protein, partial [Acidobacteriaceae bacterium]
PSVLHQDPRYFYKGVGSIRSRALYALSTVFICRGDNGRWQPNYSNVLGTFAAGGISNAYYPANDRGFQLTMENSLIGLAAGGGTALLQEFLIRKFSRGVPSSSATQP